MEISQIKINLYLLLPNPREYIIWEHQNDLMLQQGTIIVCIEGLRIILEKGGVCSNI
jgi:hypothetical protein